MIDPQSTFIAEVMATASIGLLQSGAVHLTVLSGIYFMLREGCLLQRHIAVPSTEASLLRCTRHLSISLWLTVAAAPVPSRMVPQVRNCGQDAAPFSRPQLG